MLLKATKRTPRAITKKPRTARKKTHVPRKHTCAEAHLQTIYMIYPVTKMATSCGKLVDLPMQSTALKVPSGSSGMICWP
jgi:hypothetical protein